MLKDPRLGDSPQAPSSHNFPAMENPEDIENSDLNLAEQGEKVVYRGGWRMPYRSAVTKQSVPILVSSQVGWQRVAGSSTQVQRPVFVKVTCFERAGNDDQGYSLRLHAHQPDMNISLSKDIKTRELATILLPLFRGSVSKPVARVIEDSAKMIKNEENDDDDDDDLADGIIQRSLKRFIKTGWAPRRIHLIKWLLERLRILENIKGELTLAIEPTPEEARAWVERETQRRFSMLTGGKAKMAFKVAMVLKIQSAWRIRTAHKTMKDVKDNYQELINDQKANMIQQAWKNHVSRTLLFKMGAMYRGKMEEQAAIIMQQHMRATLARLHFRHTKDAHAREVDAAIMLQAAWRRHHAEMEYERLLKEYRYECLLKRSAIIMQSWFRARVAKKKISSLRTERDNKIARIASIRIQCWWKGLLVQWRVGARATKNLENQINSVIELQRVVRGSLARSALSKWMKLKIFDHRQATAADKLISLWRGFVERKKHSEKVTEAITNIRFERRRASATIVQKEIRAALARSAFKFSRNEWSKQNAAAILVQSTWRGHDSRVKSKYMLERAKVVDRLGKQLAQAAHNRWLMEQEALRMLEEEKRIMKDKRLVIEHHQAALMVQSAWRGQVARKEFNTIRKEYDIKISYEKANQIQYAWRNRVGRNQLRALKKCYDAQLKESSAKICQQHIRGKLARMNYKVSKNKKEREISMAIRIQSNWRASKERKNYSQIQLKKAAKMEEKAAICIQCAWRSKKARKKVNKLVQEKYDALKESAAIMLQCAWRRKLAYKEYHRRREKRITDEAEENRLEILKQEEEKARAERIQKSIAEQEEKRKRMREQANIALGVDNELRKKKNINVNSKKREQKVQENIKQKEIAQREEDGRKARTKRKEDAKKRDAERRKTTILAKKAAELAKKKQLEADAEVLKPIKPKEKTMKVYDSVWEMPCDLEKEPWCEIPIKVLERHNPYRLRFEGKVKLMWTQQVANSTGGTIDLTRRAKYTVTAEQLQTVLLSAFDAEAMSPQANRVQRNKSGTANFGGKKSAEAAMMKWAQTGFSPLRERVIQWILRRMRVGVGEKCLVLKLSEEMTESYEINPNEQRKKGRRKRRGGAGGGK